MIKNAAEIKEKFENYLDKKIASNFDDYYYEGFDYQYIKEHLDEIKNKYIVFMNKDGDINNFAYYKKESGFNYFSIDSIENEILIENLNDIRKNYEKPIIEFSDSYIDCSTFPEVYKVNLKSKITDEYYNCNAKYFCLNENNKDIIVDLADELNFPQYSGNITYEILDENDVHKLTNFDEIIPIITKNSSNHYHFAGFHYFNSEYINNNNILIAKDGNNIVGALKYGLYDEDYLPHIAVCYVDVKKPYRGKGIATNLLKEFGRIMEKAHKEDKMDLPIYLTDESEMGKKCHMKEVSLKNIENVLVYYEDRDKYEYVLNFNNKEIARGNNLKSLLENVKLNRDNLER